ncbi:MAG: YihY family inner membrane protein [Burkholderiales bacterium]|nr:YihY family inner membrane protein [Burkholderiales bacterium]
MTEPASQSAAPSAAATFGRRLARFVGALGHRFVDDHGVQTAGSLTFTTLLSLVPLLTVALSLATAFPVFREGTAALEAYVVGNFLPEASGVKAIAEQINEFTSKAGQLTAIGLAFLAVTAIMLMLTIDESMNRVFRVQRRRPLGQKLLMYWGVLTLGPVLIGMSLSLTTFVVGASLGWLRMGTLAQDALRLVPFLFTWAALTLIYLVVPYRRIVLWHALVGAFCAGVAFELTKRGFALYLQKFPTYALIYGAFATIPIFLLWVYLSWLVVLVGATITAMLPAFGVDDSDRRRPPGRELEDALAVLGGLARAQEAGEAVPLTRLARRIRRMPHRCEEVLARCAALGWAVPTERDAWLLSREADSIRVADVYRAFVLQPEALSGEGPPLAEHWKHVDADLSMNLKDIAQREAAR